MASSSSNFPAYNIVHHSFMSDSTATLLYAVIKHYRAKRNDYSVALPTVENSNPELFSYCWSQYSICLLENLLEDRQIFSEFCRRQYNALARIFTEGEADLLYLTLKYDFLNVKTLEKYPVIEYNDQERRNNIVIWNCCREFRSGPHTSS